MEIEAVIEHQWLIGATLLLFCGELLFHDNGLLLFTRLSRVTSRNLVTALVVGVNVWFDDDSGEFLMLKYPFNNSDYGIHNKTGNIQKQTMRAPKYLTGDATGIVEFIDRFDVSCMR